MHLNKKKSKFLFKKLFFLINISYAGWPAGQPLYGAGWKNQPANSMRGGPARIATPT